MTSAIAIRAEAVAALAASAPGAFMLPHPRYCNGDGLSAATVLAHFIGYLRFKTRDYERCARRVARALSAEPVSALASC